MSTRIPPAALLLGFAGLAPFFWGALLSLELFDTRSLTLPAVLSGDGRLIMMRYGGIILPFMAGVLWGFATKAQGAQAATGYILSVIPALWAFFMTGGGPVSAATNLIFGFVGVLMLDYAFYSWGLTPPWWMRLRILITAIVVACLGVTVVL